MKVKTKFNDKTAIKFCRTEENDPEFDNVCTRLGCIKPENIQEIAANWEVAKLANSGPELEMVN